MSDILPRKMLSGYSLTRIVVNFCYKLALYQCVCKLVILINFNDEFTLFFHSEYFTYNSLSTLQLRF